MDAIRGNRTFEDFDPPVEWSRAAEADAVKISVPGFKREEIRVLVDNHGHLRTRGERPLAGTRWSRFQKDFKLPEYRNVDGIRAKFENETLTITIPKMIPSPQVAPAAPMPAPAPPRPEPRRPAATPAVPEPPKPTVPLVPAPPSQRQPGERRPSLPSRLPSVPTQAEFYEPTKKSEPAAAAVPKLKDQRRHGTEEEEEKRMEREAMGKMEEDRKTMEEHRKMTEEKQEQAKKEEEERAAIAETQMLARQQRPMAANRGLLVNVAVAVVLLVGITAYVWHTLKNATGHGGTGAGSYGDEM